MDEDEKHRRFGYLKTFSDAILAALTVPLSGTHFTTRFGSARIGE